LKFLPAEHILKTNFIHWYPNQMNDATTEQFT
jgi:hypothetical protein